MFHIPKPGESLTLLEKCFFRGLPEFLKLACAFGRLLPQGRKNG